ncbi:MAG: hypothetical protein GY898_18970 [Proteobacteria bacterium]|nr:hypothetical protein [Pseudomonadota bacterium]
MTWTVLTRHELTLLLDRDLSDPRRSAAVARAAGVDASPPQGVESSFAHLSRLVLTAERAGKLDALVEAATTAVTEATRVELAGLHVDAGAETERSEADVPTVREEVETIIEPTTPIADETADETEFADEDDEEPEPAGMEPEGAAPRPPGTPAQAPPTGGATSWLIRRAHVSAPTTTEAGAQLRLTVTLKAAEPGTVATAPADATLYAGGPVPLEVELWLEEGYPADGQDLHRTVPLGAEGEDLEVEFSVAVPSPLAEGVDATIRFFVHGYEVGRAKAFVPNRERDDVEPRPSTPGAVVVPDTILG